MEEFRPGQVINPAGASVSVPSVVPAPSVSPPTTPALSVSTPLAPETPLQLESVAVPIVSTPPLDMPSPAYTSSPPMQTVEAQTDIYKNEQSPSAQPSQPAATDGDTFSWVASEYLHNDKDSTWYGAYVLGSILLGGLVFLLTKDIISTVIVFLAILGLVFFASRKPKDQQYAIENGAFYIGQKVYDLQDFKAFSVNEENGTVAITLLPLKRFLPPITSYVNTDQANVVVGYLTDFLPMEAHKADAVDSLLKRIRF